MGNFLEVFINYVSINYQYLLSQTLTHMYISIIAVFFAFIIGFVIGIAMFLYPKYSNFIMSIINLIQVIPSLALLTFLMLFFGLGKLTVINTVMLYSILPIVKNTYIGVRDVDRVYIDSARSLGLTVWEELYHIRIPLAFPIILSAIKNSLILSVGITTIGSFVGSGGLGDIILRGVNITGGAPIIIVGTLLTTFVTLLFDYLLTKLTNVYVKSIN